MAVIITFINGIVKIPPYKLKRLSTAGPVINRVLSYSEIDGLNYPWINPRTALMTQSAGPTALL